MLKEGRPAARQGVQRGDSRERRRGHAARARERVCVRLINQTFAFGILAREKEEELEIAEEEVTKGQEGGRRGGGTVGQAGSSTRPEPGQAEPGRAPLHVSGAKLWISRFTLSISQFFSFSCYILQPSLFIR